MDRNRLLITGLSVAIFLTAVVVFGLLWFYPQRDSAATADAMTDVQFDPFAYLDEDSADIRSREAPAREYFPEEERAEADRLELPDQMIDGELTEVTEDGITIVFGSRERQRRIMPAGDQQSEPRETQAAPLDTPVTAPETQTTTPARQDAPTASAAEAVRSAPARSTTPTEQPTRTTAPGATTRAAESASASAAPAAQRTEASTSRSHNPRASQEYWVQVFAGSSRTNVEQAKDRFHQETTMRPLITTITHDGSVFYRLRVGPYYARQEAEKLLVQLSDSSSFTESYISVVYN